MDSSNLKVLVLGHKGMLGWVVKEYLRRERCLVEITDARWPNKDFKNFIENSKSDFVINCAAAIPQKSPRDYSINDNLPEFLCHHFQGTIVHPASNIEGFPLYDPYSISKKRGSWFTRAIRPESIIIRSSTIGPSLNGSFGIWDTVEQAEGSVFGYANHFWNGVTTLEWARFAYNMMFHQGGIYPIISPKISKYDLIKILAEKLKKEITIMPHCQPVGQDYCIEGWESRSIDRQIEDFIQWRKRF